MDTKYKRTAIEEHSSNYVTTPTEYTWPVSLNLFSKQQQVLQAQIKFGDSSVLDYIALLVLNAQDLE